MNDTKDFVTENGVLKKYVGPGGDVVIPDGVTIIGQGAFRGCVNVTGIQIPDTIGTIKRYAFWGCNSLKRIVITAGLQEIGQNLFKNCSGLKEVILPESITSIGEFAFEGCVSLNEIKLPERLQVILKGAFAGCSGLTNLTFPDRMYYIGERAFSGCSALTSVTIPGGISGIGENAFHNCDGLKSIEILSHELNIGKGAFTAGPTICSVIIPDQVVKTLTLGRIKSIFTYRELLFALLRNPSGFTGEFKNKLAALMAKDKDFYIGYFLEKDSADLFSVFLDMQKQLPIEEVDRYIDFAGKEKAAPNVKAVLLEYKERRFDREKLRQTYEEKAEKELGIKERSVEDWRKIFKFSAKNGELCISACNRRDSLIEIPEKIGKNTVTKIGARAFSHISANGDGEPADVMVVLPETIRSIGEYAFEFSNCSHISLLDSVIDLQEGVFANSSLRSVRLPEGLTEIPPKAFSECHNLETVTIPKTVQRIGSCAFWNCHSLTNISVPEGVTSIDGGAFYNCRNLASVTIPDSVTDIGPKAFEGTAVFNDDSYWVNDVIYIGNHLINARKSISGVYTVKEGTRSIADSAFEYCDKLTKVILPESIKGIGASAFFGCTGLASDDRGFVVIGNVLVAYKGPETNVTIPEGVKVIGRAAFITCKHLISVTIPEGISSIEDSAFSRCWLLKNVTIPGSVKRVGWGAFYGCQRLMNVTIREGVKIIGDAAFWGCNCLESVTIPDGVTTIGNEAFRRSGLTKIILPASVKSIGQNVFSGCPLAPVCFTIHAPAGSYAEQYAKKNKKPFVAE